MAKRPESLYRIHHDDDEPVSRFFEALFRFVMLVGLVASALGLGFLLYTYFVFAGGGPADATQQAMRNAELFGKILLGGLIATGLSTAYLFWGEEVLGPMQLLAGLLVVAAPWYLPQLASQDAPTPVAAVVLDQFKFVGIIATAFAVLVVILDVTVRVRTYAQQGSRAEQLKYGKGIKEEQDIRNVFMGRCWQLPFCRKFVREKCPIYHARRTCWKERVGCMCEESVIANAMAGKVIPKDMVAAAKYIPYNTKLSPEAKAERCRQCVIYNEHQKHKYKLTLPLVILTLIGTYALFREQLLAMMGGLVAVLDKMISQATYQDAKGAGTMVEQAQKSPIPFQEILLVCLMFVVFAYLMRLFEYLFFKLKV